MSPYRSQTQTRAVKSYLESPNPAVPLDFLWRPFKGRGLIDQYPRGVEWINPWLDRRVLHYAHQGGAREAPSSTLFALRRAVTLGASALELDVHRTADGVLVVCHDSTVDETTNATGAIAEMSFAELRALDNAYWWTEHLGEDHHADHRAETEAFVLRGRFPSQPEFGIASLDEVLNEFAGVFLNFDIKETGPKVQSYEHDLADTLRCYNRTTDVIVASFHDVALERFRAYAPEIHTSFGPTQTLESAGLLWEGKPIPKGLPGQVAFQIPMRFDGAVVVTPELVNAAHDAGLAVHVWTIDELADMRELLACGVDGIMTDCPSILAQALSLPDVSW
jgi:glycerophosphoryl diester phosphodiesterase